MSYMRINERLDKFHHGPPHPFEDAGVFSDILTSIHIAMVKCLFLVNRSCIHTGLKVSPQVKIKRIQMCGGHAVVLLYLSIGPDRCY
jgi:hypothetical protein